MWEQKKMLIQHDDMSDLDGGTAQDDLYCFQDKGTLKLASFAN
jgi:hypothetical protein